VTLKLPAITTEEATFTNQPATGFLADAYMLNHYPLSAKGPAASASAPRNAYIRLSMPRFEDGAVRLKKAKSFWMETKRRACLYCDNDLVAVWLLWFLGPFAAFSTMEVTVLLTPFIFRTLFFRKSRNSSMSAAETSVTMSNSPATSWSSSTLGNLERACATSVGLDDSTKMSTKARRRTKVNHRSWTPPLFELNPRLSRRPRIKHCC
jgi:hypothetical protein